MSTHGVGFHLSYTTTDKRHDTCTGAWHSRAPEGQLDAARGTTTTTPGQASFTSRSYSGSSGNSRSHSCVTSSIACSSAASWPAAIRRSDSTASHETAATTTTTTTTTATPLQSHRLTPRGLQHLPARTVVRVHRGRVTFDSGLQRSTFTRCNALVTEKRPRHANQRP